MKKTILIPLPLTDFDPTEVAVPWKILHQSNIDICFATSNGEAPECDPIMLTGIGLGPLSKFLCADKYGRRAYDEMISTPAFKKPIKWDDINSHHWNGVILPGGHAKGMRNYLESECLQSSILDFFADNKPVGAICHGVVLVARTRAASGKSVLHGRKTTALLGAQELFAWGLTYPWMKDYYRTYTKTVESEVTSYLAIKSDFIRGPLPFLRDNPHKLHRGFTVCDGNYVSARWPGDAHRFAIQFLGLLNQS